MNYIIPLPISLKLHKTKDKKFYLNLNVYRNAHFYELNNAKIAFGELVKPLLTNLPHIKKLTITYILYTGSNRLVDLSNICCIVDKFFCDVLTENNIIPDDNISVLTDINYQFGTIDKNNPRIEAHLNILELEEPEPMRIVLNEKEVTEALKLYINSTTSLNLKEIKVEYTNTREAGVVADINFNNGEPREVFGSSEAQKQATETIVEKTMAETSQEPTVAATPVTEVVRAEVKPMLNPTSAGVAEKQEAPTSVTSPKSLFGNLTQPKNSTE